MTTTFHPRSMVTTTNQHWYLDKYSVSRLSSNNSTFVKLNTVGKPTGSGAGTNDSEKIEWDHYTQPQLHLHLETISTPHSLPRDQTVLDNKSHSMQDELKLTILFEPLPNHQSSHPMTSNSNSQSTSVSDRHILLESIELSTFSDPILLALLPRDQAPLKAVYKGSVVGLRYLVKHQTNEAAFKRFQAKFQNDIDALSFVQAIQRVCPVKPAESNATAIRLGDNGVMDQITRGRDNDGDARMGETAPPSLRPVIAPASSVLPIASYTPLPLASLLPATFSNLHSSLIAEATKNPTPLNIQSTVNLLELDRASFDSMLGKILMDENLVEIVKRVEESLKN